MLPRGDFGYYWFHRLSHEVNFLWAAHVVHHQSEDYNLAVALRQSTLQPFFGSIFYWPLALLGFPRLVFLACASFNTIYQFWLHTQAIGTLGPLEAVLVTPSAMSRASVRPQRARVAATRGREE